MREHYAVRLRRQIADLRQDKALALEAVDELRRYMSLPKFHTDTGVNVGDVFDRIEPVRSALIADSFADEL